MVIMVIIIIIIIMCGRVRAGGPVFESVGRAAGRLD